MNWEACSMKHQFRWEQIQNTCCLPLFEKVHAFMPVRMKALNTKEWLMTVSQIFTEITFHIFLSSLHTMSSDSVRHHAIQFCLGFHLQLFGVWSLRLIEERLEKKVNWREQIDCTCYPIHRVIMILLAILLSITYNWSNWTSCGVAVLGDFKWATLRTKIGCWKITFYRCSMWFCDIF